MWENLIIYGIALYFLGLLITAVVAMLQGSFKKASIFFIFSNLLGFAAGAAYLGIGSGQVLSLAKFSWLLDFAPRVNLLAGIFFTAISGVSVLIGIYSLRYLELYKQTYRPGLVQSLMAIFVLGMQGVLLANNAFGFLFFWEVMSVTSFFLVMADKSQASFKAAFLYFIMTHLGASAIMAGFLILSHGSLSFELQNIAVASAGLSPAMLGLTFILFLFGFGSKAGLVPFHVWLPEAHPQAPSNISAMMSGLMLKVAVYGFITVVFSLAQLPSWAGILVIVLGLLSGMVGVLHALVEKDLKRVLAFSSIENMGIIFTMLGLALFLATKTSLSGVAAIGSSILAFAIFHALNHLLFKTGLFLSSGIMINRVHSRSLELMGGLAKLMPLFSFAFLLSILGSLPIAPFGTFYGEWGFIQGVVSLFGQSLLGVNTQLVLISILSLFCLISGLAIFAMVRVFVISMQGLPRAKHLDAYPEKLDRLLIWPVMVLASFVLLFGVFAKPILGWLIKNANLFAKPASSQSNFLMRSVSLSSWSVFVLFIIVIALAVLAKKLIVRNKQERIYHTWDCGQPINASMEYSATAFSAPVRFFFLRFLSSVKMINSVPIVATNPWIKKYNFTLEINSFWHDKFYQPVAKLFVYLADRVKFIQSGRIQYYLFFLLITLIIVLIIAL